jgi:hypothetical protein
MIKKTTVVLAGWLLGVVAMLCVYRLASELPAFAVFAAFIALGLGMGACASLLPWIVTQKPAFSTACFFLVW